MRDKEYTLAVPGMPRRPRHRRVPAQSVAGLQRPGRSAGRQHRRAPVLHRDRLLHRHQREGPPDRPDRGPATIYVNQGKLSGQIEAWSAAWNKLYFNQGSPKPNGSHPGLTLPLSGTYNASTHAFVITWTSQVVGGPFNGFTGHWHLAGTFFPAK